MKTKVKSLKCIVKFLIKSTSQLKKHMALTGGPPLGRQRAALTEALDVGHRGLPFGAQAAEVPGINKKRAMDYHGNNLNRLTLHGYGLPWK